MLGRVGARVPARPRRMHVGRLAQSSWMLCYISVQVYFSSSGSFALPLLECATACKCQVSVAVIGDSLPTVKASLHERVPIRKGGVITYEGKSPMRLQKKVSSLSEKGRPDHRKVSLIYAGLFLTSLYFVFV